MLIKLILQELKFRWGNTLLLVSTLTLGVAFFILFFLLSINSKNETRVLTRDLGFNLRIVSSQTNMNRFWANGYSDALLNQEDVYAFGKAKNFSFAHLTAMLTRSLEWEEQPILVTGISSTEIEPSGRKKSKMTFAVPASEVVLGYHIAKSHDYKKGDVFQFRGKSYSVNSVLMESGTTDDGTLYFNLEELQELLHLQGKISEIRAINCMCILDATGHDPLQLIRKELNHVLPHAYAIRKEDIAKTREKQRLMMDGFSHFLLPIVFFICFAWTVALFALNAKHRMKEVAILKSLGYSSAKVFSVFWIKALLIGLCSAVFGYALGTFLCLNYGPSIFITTAKAIRPVPMLLLGALVATPLFTILASLVPTLWAVQKPSVRVLQSDV